MALSALDRKKRQLEREEAARKALLDPILEIASRPFFQYLEEDSNWSSVQLAFDMMGVEPPSITDDSDPQSAWGQVEQISRNFAKRPFDNLKGSIGRAELMVDCLIDAATELASIINRYKREAIATRITELEAADLQTADERKSVVQDLVRFAAMKAKLEKEFRRSFREISLKGL